MECRYCNDQIPDGSTYCPSCGTRLQPDTPLPVAHMDSEFGQQLSRATAIWKENLGGLVLISLVFLLVAWIPIVNVAFLAGYTRALVRLSRGGTMQTGDIFTAWDCFGNALAYAVLFFLALLLATAIPFFGPIAQFAVALLGTPGLYLVLDRNRNALEAVKWSLNTVQRHLLPWLMTVLVGGVLGSAGILVCFLGIIVTLPWGTLLVIQQYEQALHADPV